MPVINIKNLNKKFGANEVLRDINLTVEKGEVVAIIGPSGSGKSTFTPLYEFVRCTFKR